MKNFDLFNAFISKVLGKPIDSTTPVMLSGWEVVEALWPLNELFRPNIEQIKSISYDPFFEAELDAALEKEVMRDADAESEAFSPGAWRVFLERQQQAIVLALANEVAGNPVMPIPSELPESARSGAAMLFLLHGMKLPFPVVDRSGFALPQGPAPASLRRH